MPCYSPLQAYQEHPGGVLFFSVPSKPHRRLTIGCGRCHGCRLDRARNWAIRIMHESKMHVHSQFVTLTYRDEQLLKRTGELHTLHKPHLQKFFKRLRKATNGGIRYFACGEYGESTYRPHYHACIFGLNLKDKKFYSNKNGYDIYSSEFLDTIWGHGHTRIGSVTFESASYVARYIMGKKLGDQSSWYTEQDIESEFVCMSLKPGIGATFFQKFQSDIFPVDSVIVQGRKVSSAPKYYLKLWEREQPLLAQWTKFIRNIKAMEFSDSEEMSPRRIGVRERIALRKAQGHNRPGAFGLDDSR